MSTRMIDDGVLLHDDANESGIAELFVFLSTDDTGEGILASTVNGMLMSLVTSKSRIAEQMKPLSEKISAASGKPIKLVNFTAREDVWP
jgi:hypothetical protein